MPIDRPDANELITAVREHLSEHVAPLLEGQPAFHLRVATNALAIVERTLAEGEVMELRERERLKMLLGEEGDLLTLNDRLSKLIREDAMAGRRNEILEHLRETAADKLRLANPRYGQRRHE